MKNKLLTPQQIMSLSPIIPVIEIEDLSQSVDLANALITGGINVLEITLRTSAAIDAISLLTKEVPSAIIGAGTVLNSTDLEKVRNAGASFAISPGCTNSLLKHAKEIDFPLIPGVSTGSEVMKGLDLGYTHFKLFPATSVGGIPLLKSFSGPFQQAKFCPTGGINEENYLDFLSLDNVLCIGGSWIASSKLIIQGDFNKITETTRSSLAKIVKD